GSDRMTAARSLRFRLVRNRYFKLARYWAKARKSVSLILPSKDGIFASGLTDFGLRTYFMNQSTLRSRSPAPLPQSGPLRPIGPPLPPGIPGPPGPPPGGPPVGMPPTGPRTPSMA